MTLQTFRLKTVNNSQTNLRLKYKSPSLPTENAQSDFDERRFDEVGSNKDTKNIYKSLRDIEGPSIKKQLWDSK